MQFPNILEEDWDLMFSSHLKGTLFCIQEVARRVMIPKCSGRIVNVSSLAAHGKYSATAYGVAKAAISHLTLGCAVSLGEHGITVNCVSPGMVATPIYVGFWEGSELRGKELPPDFVELMTKDRVLDLDRVGTGKDIANAILFLVSEAASYITGVDLNVSAGQVMYY
jgi:3-oxoacyl-[acyl-carrier protein] reductase